MCMFQTHVYLYSGPLGFLGRVGVDHAPMCPGTSGLAEGTPYTLGGLGVEHPVFPSQVGQSYIITPIEYASADCVMHVVE